MVRCLRIEIKMDTTFRLPLQLFNPHGHACKEMKLALRPRCPHPHLPPLLFPSSECVCVCMRERDRDKQREYVCERETESREGEAGRQSEVICTRERECVCESGGFRVQGFGLNADVARFNPLPPSSPLFTWS